MSLLRKWRDSRSERRNPPAQETVPSIQRNIPSIQERDPVTAQTELVDSHRDFPVQQEDSAAQFKYSDLPENGIRLVTLTQEDGVILRVYDKHHAPEYNALSYVCGENPSPPIHFIHCRDPDRDVEGLLPVAPNLYEALNYFKYVDIPIWIDAICIKQTSNEEKEILVPRMDEIYRQAKYVFIWLGPSDETSDVAMAFISAICAPDTQPVLVEDDNLSISISEIEATRKVLHEDTAIEITPENFAHLGLPRYGHPIWAALCDLFVRPWTTRIWTFQEAMVAKCAMVVCGRAFERWTEFLDLTLKFVRTQIIYQEISRIPHNFTAYQFPTDNTGKWFLLYLINCRTRFCSLKEDRIYALLSLASAKMRAEIPVKYSLTDPNHYQSVYLAVGREMIKQSSKYPLSVILAAASSHDKPTNIPSWCPDWSLPGKSAPIGGRARAGYPLNHLESYQVHPQRLHSIIVHGACVDKVKDVIDHYDWYYPDDDISGVGGPADKLFQWLCYCRHFVNRVVGEDDGWTAYWETMFGYIEGMMQDDLPPYPDDGLQALGRQLLNDRACIPREDQDLSPTELTALNTVVGYLERIWKGRVFISTRGGRVGYADKGVKKGAMVCVFFGQPALYILRSKSTVRYNGGNEVEFCSRAYVHGLMMGEACELIRREDMKMFEIT